MKRFTIAIMLIGLFSFNNRTFAQTVYNYIHIYDYDDFWNVTKTYTEEHASLRLIFHNGGESVAVQMYYGGAWHDGTSVYHYERDGNGWDIYYIYETPSGAVFSNYLYVKKDKTFVRHDVESKFADFGWKSIKAKGGYKLSK